MEKQNWRLFKGKRAVTLFLSFKDMVILLKMGFFDYSMPV